MRLPIFPNRGTTSTTLLINFIFAHSLWASPLLGQISPVEMTQDIIVPRRGGQSSFTWVLPENGWKVKFLKADLPIPNNLGVSGLKRFYSGLLDNIASKQPGPSIIAASQETIHLGSQGGLWVNIRSVNIALSREAVTHILEVLVRRAQRGWAPLFTAE